MFNMKFSMFSGTRELEQKIDEMHDKVLESSLYFKEAFEIYLKEKRSQNYRRASKKIKNIEAKADDLRREIEKAASIFITLFRICVPMCCNWWKILIKLSTNLMKLLINFI